MEILHGFANIASGFSLTCMQGRDTGSEQVETRSDFSVLQNLLNIRQEIKQYLAWENESLGFDLLLSVAIHWNVLTDGGKVYSVILFILLVPEKLLKMWIQKYSLIFNSLSWKIRSVCSPTYTVSQEVTEKSGKVHLCQALKHLFQHYRTTICLPKCPAVYLAKYRLSSLAGYLIQPTPIIC